VLDVLAALRERVESHKQSVGSDLPLILGLSLVLKVSILEFGADVESKNKLLMCLLRLFTLNEGEDLWTINVVAASVDDGVANLADQHNKS